jgi:hypothetical protein
VADRGVQNRRYENRTVNIVDASVYTCHPWVTRNDPVGDLHQMDWLVCRNGKSFDAPRANDAAGEDAVATFACEIMLNMNGCKEMSLKGDRRSASIRVPSKWARKRAT